MQGASGDARTVPGAPRLPGFAIRRPRLLDLLDGDAPIHVVRAPAGAGKTILLADWIRSAGHASPRVWLGLDPRAAERLAFWSLVVERLEDAGLVPPESSLAHVVSALDTTPDLRELLRRGLADIEAGLILVLDDYDFASDEVSADLGWLVQRLPGLRVVAACRGATPLESIALATRSGASTVPPDELRFTSEEVGEVLRRARLDPSSAEAVHAATDGLPLIVRGTALSLARTPLEERPGALEERLARLVTATVDELLATTWEEDEELRVFAVRISLAEAVDAELARRLTGSARSAELLDRVVEAGLGTWTADATAERAFVFTRVVRESLRRELGSRFPERRADATRILVEWLLEHGRGYQAFAHAIEAADYALASRVARLHFFDLIRHPAHSVGAMLRPIPKLTLRRYPLLSLMLAILYNALRTHRLQALEYLALASYGTRTQRKSAPPDERVVLLGVETTSLRVAGRIGAAVAAAESLAAAVDDLTIEQRDGLATALPALFAQSGLAFLHDGRTERALECFDRSVSLMATTDPDTLPQLANTAGTLALRGEVDKARLLVERLRVARWPEGWRDGYRGSLYHLAEAFLAVEEFDHPRAVEHVAILAPHLDTIEHWPFLAHVRALGQLGLGEAALSAAALKREQDDHRRVSVKSFPGALVTATRSLLLLASGRATEAAGLLARAPELPSIGIARALLALLADEPEDVVARLAVVDAGALEPRLHAQVSLLHAAAALRLGRTEPARAAVEEAAAVMLTCGMRHPLSLLPRRDRAALAAIASSPARELLRDERVADVLPSRVTRIALTEREHVVLDRIARGGSLTEIAGELYVSVNTLKTQLRTVYRKLGAGSREEALAIAAEHGLLPR